MKYSWEKIGSHFACQQVSFNRWVTKMWIRMIMYGDGCITGQTYVGPKMGGLDAQGKTRVGVEV